MVHTSLKMAWGMTGIGITTPIVVSVRAKTTPAGAVKAMPTGMVKTTPTGIVRTTPTGMAVRLRVRIAGIATPTGVGVANMIIVVTIEGGEA